MSEFVVGQWVEVIDGMAGYLRVGHVHQIEKITDIGTIKLFGNGNCWDAARFKPFQWQVGKTYRTTLEGVTATIARIKSNGDIFGTVERGSEFEFWWHAKTGKSFSKNICADLLPYLADEPSKADAKPDASDPINPQHYRTHTSGVECIEIAEHYSYCRGNAIKYLLQAGQEDDEFIALKQAAWYLQREIERLEKQRKGGA